MEISSRSIPMQGIESVLINVTENKLNAEVNQMLTDGQTDRQTDRRTDSSIHKPELLCDPAKKHKNYSLQ